MLERIRALYRLADRTTFPEEAETARRLAWELQAKHGITDAMLAAPPSAPRPVIPQPQGWVVVGFGSGGFYGNTTNFSITITFG